MTLPRAHLELPRSMAQDSENCVEIYAKCGGGAATLRWEVGSFRKCLSIQRLLAHTERSQEPEALPLWKGPCILVRREFQTGAISAGWFTAGRHEPV